MKKIHFISLFAAVILFSCNPSQDQELTSVDAQDGISSQVGGLLDDDQGLTDMPVYRDDVPGAAKNIDRSFENAPPLIPHSTTGMLPIRTDFNLCANCHMPEMAKNLNGTAMPESHFTNYRPDVVEVGGKYNVDAKEGEVYEVSLGDKISNARYNCTQCHVPQAKIDPMVQNNFERVLRDQKSMSSSNLDMSDGVK